MLEKLLAAAGFADQPAVLIARASRLSAAAPLDPWRPCLLVLDAPLSAAAAALRHYPPDHPLTLISEGTDGLDTREAQLSALADGCGERAAAAALPAAPLHEVRAHAEGLRGVIDRLRDPIDGCPWDNAQTHLSLRPHLLEETYEALDAIAGGDSASLCEELGDVLMQVVLHAKLAEQEGAFDLGDVSEGIRAKLVRRHPHVFGDASVDSAAGTELFWERLKARERPLRESLLDGVPRALPALARAQSVLGRAERNGLPRAARGGSIGEQILDLVLAARQAGLSAEDEARGALDAFELRVRALEAELRNEGRTLEQLDAEELGRRWAASSRRSQQRPS